MLSFIIPIFRNVFELNKIISEYYVLFNEEN